VSETVYRTYLFLVQLVAFLPIGTNQGILHILWTILTGKLLNSRGAIFPALKETRLNDQQCRRAEAALRDGKVKIDRLIEQLTRMVKQEQKSDYLTLGNWNPLLIDWVGFYRPHLKGCVSKHFASVAGKALPAIELGMIARCLTIGNRRIPLLCGLNRSGKTLPLLSAARALMQKNDVLVADRQVKISHIEQTNISHFVIRGAVDFTAHEKDVVPKGGPGRRPTMGRIVRPLARTYKDKVIEATAPHREESFIYQGRILTALWFENLVLSGSSLCFHCVVIRDPKYKSPLVLLTSLHESARIIFGLYRSRWKIEQIPQTGKQLLGGHRSFVHADESRYRLPELCLLSASVCLYLSATSKAIATGFWDRHPKPTPGRFRRVLSDALLPEKDTIASELPTLSDFSGKVRKMLGRIRVKRSVFGHLPLGAVAHTRQKNQQPRTSVTGN
jgi:hypothetical protein